MSTETRRKHHGRVIDTRISVDTDPMTAWNAWADPQQIANWFVDRAEGVAKPGEVMTWFFDTFNYRLPVPIVEAEPGRTFVTGGGDAPGPQGLPYLMEISISHERGATTMRLVNSGFSTDATHEEEYEGVVSGWDMALATLKYWLEHHPSRQRVHRLALRPAPPGHGPIAPWFRTTEGRRAWLSPLIEDDARVLVDTGREVLLEWTTRRGVLGIKAFRMGPSQMLGLDFSTWPEDAGTVDVDADALPDALSRLVVCLTK